MRPGAFDVIGERGSAECEDYIVPSKKTHDLLAHRRKEAGEERVVLGEAAASRHRRCPYRCVVPFGEPHHVAPGAVAVDRRTDHESRTRRRVERLANRVQHARLGSDLSAHDTRRQRLATLRPVVGRN